MAADAYAGQKLAKCAGTANAGRVSRPYVICSRHDMGLRIAPSAFPKPGLDEVVTSPSDTRTIVLGGGLFWCIDALFRPLTGVVSVRPGYSGGTKAHANFETVSSGRSEHVFVVEIVYEPAKLALGPILQVFFSIAHDPTLPERKGVEAARAQRSVIYFTTPAQRSTALNYIARLQQAGVFNSLILTDVSPLASFFEAEALHHDYAANHPRQPHVRTVTLPKLNMLSKLHSHLLKAPP
jgi:peptide-methionine (S)-S-oxide reductase